METLEFVIYPDGRVKEMVTGIVGTSCEAVTEAIESALGEVVAHQNTSEYYAQPVRVSATERSSMPTHVCESQW